MSEAGVILTVKSGQDELYNEAAGSFGPAIARLAHAYEADPDIRHDPIACRKSCSASQCKVSKCQVEQMCKRATKFEKSFLAQCAGIRRGGNSHRPPRIFYRQLA